MTTSLLRDVTMISELSTRWLSRMTMLVLICVSTMCREIETKGDDEEPPRSKFNRVLAIGDPAPEYDGLIGTDGKRHSLADHSNAKVVIVLFIRNLCPTTHAYEKRLIDYAAKVKEKSVEIVAICVSKSPSERLDRFALRAKEKGYPWLNLHDESQFIGHQFGATVTPQIFVLDEERKIAYMGAFDDDVKPEKVKRRFVEEAVTALLAGKRPEITETLARGCEIEYSKD